jgi:Transglycosylase SLT domain
MRALLFLAALNAFTIPAGASTPAGPAKLLAQAPIVHGGENDPRISVGTAARGEAVPNLELPTRRTAFNDGRPDPRLVPGVEPEFEPSNAGRRVTTPTRAGRLSPAASGPDRAPAMSHGEMCHALAATAQAHGLPVGFFSNLIWQESRFNARSVSRKGAQGVAQFMPKTASKVGLSNPFNPSEALPAAARLLNSLLHEFGNFGLAAAAYNAGHERVSRWLAKGGELPGETRHYVIAITGRPVDAWRGARLQPVLFRLPPSMPCRHIEIFAQADEAARQQETREREERERQGRDRNARRKHRLAWR